MLLPLIHSDNIISKGSYVDVCLATETNSNCKVSTEPSHPSFGQNAKGRQNDTDSSLLRKAVTQIGASHLKPAIQTSAIKLTTGLARTRFIHYKRSELITD